MDTTAYTASELQEALDSLWKGVEDPDFDARHIFGYQDPKHELSKLQTITATRILDYQRFVQKNDAPTMDQLLLGTQEFCETHGPILNLQAVIAEQAPRMALAAEFKRASPSKGDIASGAHCGEQALNYATAGANIISVLTEQHWFKGSLDDMEEARICTNSIDNKQRPAILRKDFVINEYMIAEAASRGADTVLLIVAVLPQTLLTRLICFCRNELQMEPLVEVHADIELEVAIQAGARVIGVNNRNLHTFQMDLTTSSRVAKMLKSQDNEFQHGSSSAEYTVCALSGMSNAMDVHRYRQDGIGMCLIGESLMRAADPKAAIEGLCLHPDQYQQQLPLTGGAYTGGTKIVKVCGVTNGEDAQVACQAGANLIGVIFVPQSKRCVTTEQALEIVHAVRAFGERTSRMSWEPSQSAGVSPVSKITSSAYALQQLSAPLVVGVFQNQEPKFVQQMVEKCGLDAVQLHGQEGMQACSPEQTGGVPAIRVVDVEVDPSTGKASDEGVDSLVDNLTTDPSFVLLDTAIKGNEDGGGGTGVTFDWSLAERIQAKGLPVIIAGGLNPDNVKDCVAVARPFGIDVSSGVEQAPGTKDHQKVRAFVRGAKEAALEANKGF